MLIKYGGHELAAGLTIHKDNVAEFRMAINEFAKNTFDFSSVCNYLNADFEIDVVDVTVDNAKQLQELEPFGLRNPQPLFCIKDVEIKEIYSIGEGKHLKLIVEKNGYLATALYFGVSVDKFNYFEGDKVDLMCNMDMNDFRGTLSVQIVLKDVRMSESEQLTKLHNENEYKRIMSGDLSIDKTQIPSIIDLRASFLYLKSAISLFDVEKNIDVWDSSRAVSKQYNVNCSSLKFYIILTVFEEMNLISISNKSDGKVCVKLLKTEKKVDIENSEFLYKLKNYNL